MKIPRVRGETYGVSYHGPISVTGGGVFLSEGTLKFYLGLTLGTISEKEFCTTDLLLFGGNGEDWVIR